MISKTLESDLNGKIRTPAITYDDADIQVNQTTVAFAAIASTTIRTSLSDHLKVIWSVLANSRFCMVPFHTGSVLFKFSVQV